MGVIEFSLQNVRRSEVSTVSLGLVLKAVGVPLSYCPLLPAGNPGGPAAVMQVTVVPQGWRNSCMEGIWNLAGWAGAELLHLIELLSSELFDERHKAFFFLKSLYC